MCQNLCLTGCWPSGLKSEGTRTRTTVQNFPRESFDIFRCFTIFALHACFRRSDGSLGGSRIHTRGSAIVLRNKETPFGLGTSDPKNEA